MQLQIFKLCCDRIYYNSLLIISETKPVANVELKGTKGHQSGWLVIAIASDASLDVFVIEARKTNQDSCLVVMISINTRTSD